MPYCPQCGAPNNGDANFCAGCGAPLKKPGAGNGTGAAAPTPAPPPERRGDNVRKIAVLAAAVVALVGLVIFFVHIWKPATCTVPETCAVCGRTRSAALGHKWTEATCTEPETCRRCGEERSPALGHDWKAATCTEPETCRRCGETQGAARGHTWRAATYESPKTCSVCGVQSGKPKGFVGVLKGDWGDTSLTLHEQTLWPYELDTPINNCFRMKIDLQLTDVSGTPYGKWYVYVRDLSGQWRHIAKFNVDQNVGTNVTTYDIEFDEPTSFSAIALVVKNNYAFNMKYAVSFYDAQVSVD